MFRIGEWIRTPYKRIEKIENISKELDWIGIFTNYGCYDEQWLDKQDIKHDFSKINLIEEGDYVNGQLITRVIPEDICGDESLENQHVFSNDVEIFEKDIKTIVTKEKFKSVEDNIEE